MRGYLAGINGKSKSKCPSEHGESHNNWMSGWREGRIDQWDGMRGVSSLQKINQITHQV